METQKDLGVLGSSADSTQVANTVRGAILALSGLIIYLAEVLGFSIAQGDVATWASHIGITAGTLWALYGIIQKVVLAIYNKVRK